MASVGQCKVGRNHGFDTRRNHVGVAVRWLACRTVLGRLIMTVVKSTVHRRPCGRGPIVSFWPCGMLGIVGGVARHPVPDEEAGLGQL